MPKAKLEFNLPEEEQDFKLASRGGEYFSVIWEALNDIRNYLKHGHSFKTIEEALENVRETLLDANIDDIK